MRFHRDKDHGDRSFGGIGLALTVGIVGAVLFSLPAAATTTPSTTVLVEVVVTPKSVVVGKYASSATHDGFISIGGPIPRGDFLNFRVLNRGTHPLAFKAFGKKTNLLKPGKIGHFNALALRRGSFPYSISITGGKTVRGSLLVD